MKKALIIFAALCTGWLVYDSLTTIAFPLTLSERDKETMPTLLTHPEIKEALRGPKITEVMLGEKIRTAETVIKVTSKQVPGGIIYIIGSGRTHHRVKVYKALVVSKYQYKDLPLEKRSFAFFTLGAVLYLREVSDLPTNNALKAFELGVGERLHDLGKWFAAHKYKVDPVNTLAAARHRAIIPILYRKLAKGPLPKSRLATTLFVKRWKDLAEGHSFFLKATITAYDTKGVIKKGMKKAAKKKFYSKHARVFPKELLLEMRIPLPQDEHYSWMPFLLDISIETLQEYWWVFILFFLLYLILSKGEELTIALNTEKEELEEERWRLFEEIQELLESEFTTREEKRELRPHKKKLKNASFEECSTLSKKLEGYRKRNVSRSGIKKQKLAKEKGKREEEERKKSNAERQKQSNKNEKAQAVRDIPNWITKVQTALATCKNLELKEEIEGKFNTLLTQIPTSGRPKKDLKALKNFHAKLTDH